MPSSVKGSKSRFKRLFLVGVFLSPLVLSSCSTVPVLAENGSYGSGRYTQVVETETERVKEVARKYNLLPSFLLAVDLVESKLGLVSFNVEEFAKGIYLDDTEANRLIADTASVDEALAVYYAERYEAEPDLVGAVNAVYQSDSYVRGLDTSVYSTGYKPLYDYAEVSEKVKSGTTVVDSGLEPLQSLRLTEDAPQGVSVTQSAIETGLYIEKSILGQNPTGVSLLASSYQDKAWWEFWKKGEPIATGLKFEEGFVQPNLRVLYAVQALQSIYGEDLEFKSASYGRMDNGVFTYGSNEKKVLLSETGQWLGVWQKSGVFKGLSNSPYKQAVRGLDGVITFGLRSGNLYEKPLFRVSRLEKVTGTSVPQDIQTLATTKGIRISYSFYLDSVMQTYYLEQKETKDGENEYVVYSRNMEVVGISNLGSLKARLKEGLEGTGLSSSLTSYTPLETEVGVLWVNY